MNTIGLDAGANKIRIGLINEKHKIVKKQIFATPQKAEEVLNLIFQGIKKFHNLQIKKIGLGIAGQIDAKRGVANFWPNFPKGLKNIPLKKILEKKFKSSVFIDNDAHCFTLAEALLGRAKNYSFVIGVTLGTGIGGGIVIDKKILRGKNNASGEIGHQIIEIGGEKCRCGKKGCWEAYASGSAMSKLYQKTTGQSKDVLSIKKEFLEGNSDASAVVRKTADYLAVGLSNLINILNPEILVLGGGLSNFKEFIDLTKKQTKNLILSPKARKTPIVVSKLSDNAGLIGAALLK